jgi:hypothetical protein
VILRSAIIFEVTTAVSPVHTKVPVVVGRVTVPEAVGLACKVVVPDNEPFTFIVPVTVGVDIVLFVSV